MDVTRFEFTRKLDYYRSRVRVPGNIPRIATYRYVEDLDAGSVFIDF